MISRLTGRVMSVNGTAVELEVGPLCYTVLVPRWLEEELRAAAASGAERTLFTIQYLEGNLGGSNLTPRLVGFPSPQERAFFELLTEVKGISMRRALRAMCVPAGQIAAAIERGDERLLTSLPEIGKKTAGQIVAELRGRLTEFLTAAEVGPVTRTLTEAQLMAVEVLVGWGDRRGDAERWVAAAVEADAGLTAADEIVRAAYRQRMAAR